jgi:broad specificity phosphatase PhoE
VTTTVYLVRHATHDRVSRILCGRMPGVILGDEGRRQAERLAERFARERIAAVLTSPLERSRETAEIIAKRLGLEAQVCEDLNEIDFGEWSGKRFDALHDDPRWWLWNDARGLAQPPGGESMSAAQSRVVRRIERLRDEHPEAGVALVSHCDVIKAALARYLGLPLDAYSLFEISPASVSVLALWPGGAKVVSMNEAVAA